MLEQHYDAAQGYQSAGNLTEAARQYRIFIADVLGELAIERAHGVDYDKAPPLFDEALILAPNSPVLEIEYAQAAFAHSDLSHARSLAEQVIRNYRDNAKACAKAHLVLGRTRLCARSRQRKSSLEEKRRDGRRDVRINIERQFPLQETAVPPI